MCSKNINLSFLGSILISKCDKKSIPIMGFNVSAMQNSQFKPHRTSQVNSNIFATKRRDRASINSRQIILWMISRIRVHRNYRTRIARVNQNFKLVMEHFMYSSCNVRVGHSFFSLVKLPFFTGAISLNDYFENETMRYLHAKSKRICIYELNCHNGCGKNIIHS